MRKRNREINIFNLSMLDVISGAMAAFLIIMIVLLPYYRKEHIDYQAIIAALRDQLAEAMARADAADALAEAARKAAEEAQSQAQAAQSSAAAARAEAERAKADAEAARARAEQAKARADSLEKKDLDLVIVLDTTASMSDEMERLKADLKGLVQILEVLSKRLRVGLVAYRDRESPGYLVKPFTLTVTDASGMRRLTDFVNALDLGNGVDWEEAVDEGLAEALRQPWDPAAEAIIVVIGDARARDDSVQRAYRLAEEFAARGERYRVSTISGTGQDARDPAFFRELAAHGGGVYIASTTELLTSIILSIFK